MLWNWWPTRISKPPAKCFCNYQALVRSKLDYGSVVYGSARPYYLKELNVVHNQGLGICLGAYRASPINSLLVETNEYTLTDRRLKLSLQYAVKLYSTPKHPAFCCVFRPRFRDLYADKPSAIKPLGFTAIKPLGLRIKPHLEAAHIDLSMSSQKSLPSHLPWLSHLQGTPWAFFVQKGWYW